MSNLPSPGPSQQQTATHHPAPSRQKHPQKQYALGITAGAEDAKYQTKYKELKRKVKEIEADNDKLHFKVLQSKRGIQRLKVERALLYDQLAPSETPPDISADRNFQPVPAGPALPPGAQVPPRPVSSGHSEHSASIDVDHPQTDYGRPRGRIDPSPDPRALPAMETPLGSGVPPPSSHNMPIMHSPRRTPSASSLDSRHLASLSVHQQQYEPGRAHSHPHLQASPPSHHAHPTTSHERSHSSSRRLPAGPTQSPYHSGSQQYHENLPHVQHVMHSPPLSERERMRLSDMQDIPPSHGDPHSRSRVQLSPRAHSSDSRNTPRVHNHQRMGPGTYVNRDDPYERGRERQLEIERERDWERSRDAGRLQAIHSPPNVHRPRQDYLDQAQHHLPSRGREDAYYHDIPGSSGYPRISRSGTPGSGSGSTSGNGGGDIPSRPDSRTGFYDHNDRARSFKLRPVSQPSEDMEYAHEGSRSRSRDRTGAGNGNTGGNPGPGGFSQIQEQNRNTLESRKRNRGDMDVDMDNDVAESGGSLYAVGRIQEDRGGKRYHRDHLHRGGPDNQDDERMGHV